MPADRTFRAGFLFCGLGAGARGFIEARGQLGPDRARFVNVGGVDVDPEACADFERLTGGGRSAAAASGYARTAAPSTSGPEPQRFGRNVRG